MIKMDIKYHCIFGFVIRLSLIVYGIVQDNILNIKYTDIDYQVFTDAAEYVSNGDSPFKRHTYRYTPFLAHLLIPNVTSLNAFGKIIFCILDIATSILIYYTVKLYCKANTAKNSALLWLYNPIAMIISSRGNAESVMTTLVMLTIYFFLKSKFILSGLVYGLSVHFKIYPCIYALTFYFSCSNFVEGKSKFKLLFFPNKKKITFVFFSAIGFLLPTIFAFMLYGEKYLWEALLYHIVRKDIRHNFSPYFYVLYLSEAVDEKFSVFLSIFSLSIQFLSILITAWVFPSSKLLPITLFLETFLFVSLNKVCTSQYFLWYICLFPLVYPLLNIPCKQIFFEFILWLFSQGIWLLFAYFLEFKGENVYIWICIASLLFYSINMYIICSITYHVKSMLSAEISRKLI